jgi:hypothetical protein
MIGFKNFGLGARVARWYIFKPKIQIWVNFGGSWNEKCWYIYGHLGCLTTLWYILGPFGIFFPFWYTKMLLYFMDILVYISVILYILWPFGIFCGNLVYFSPFWYIVARKIWQPCSEQMCVFTDLS